MARGKSSSVGDRNISANGYHYIRTETGWRLEHHVIAEDKFGIKIDSDYTVRFIDKNRHNLRPDNIMIMPKGQSSLRKRMAILEARRDEVQAQIDALEKELNEEV